MNHLSFANVQHRRKHYITHSCPQPIFSISAFMSKYKDNIGVKLKLLNCIQQYASRRLTIPALDVK